MPALPLEGVRVIELARLLPGPFATKILADLGASVDKIEDPGMGDYLRSTPPMVDGMGAVFHALNSGKRSVVIDLKTSEGSARLLELVRGADVLVETFRPGTLTKLGLSADTLAARNPGLIQCSISGYGATGPLRDRAGHDINYIARAGVLALSGSPQAVPEVPGIQTADMTSGLYAAVAILAALYERQRTGRGRVVDISMCESAMAVGVFGLVSALTDANVTRGAGVLSGGIAAYRVYRTSDGKFVALGALEPKFWQRFCESVGIAPDLEALRPGSHQSTIQAEVAACIATRTREEWIRFNETHDCCLEPVWEPGELPFDPQHRARGVFTHAATPRPELTIPPPMLRPGERGPTKGSG